MIKHFLWPVPFLFLCFLCPGWEFRLRSASLVCQLVGVGIVAFNLHQTQKDFGVTGFWSGLVAKIKRLWWRLWRPSIHGRVTTMQGVGHLTTATGTVTARAIGTSLEERVAELEDRQKLLKADLRDTQHRIGQEAELRKAEIETERRKREEQEEEIKASLKSAIAGNVHLEWAGLVWLVIGMVLGTFSPELGAQLNAHCGY